MDAAAKRLPDYTVYTHRHTRSTRIDYRTFTRKKNDGGEPLASARSPSGEMATEPLCSHWSCPLNGS